MCKEKNTVFEEKYKDFIEEKRSHQVDENGIQIIFRFPNKKGLSCIKTRFSYGGTKGLWEIGLLGNCGGLSYDDDKFIDVIGYLEEKEVCEYLKYIKEFKWPEKCDCCNKEFDTEAGHIKLFWREKWFCDECCENEESIVSGYNLNDIYELYDHLKDMRDGYDYYRSKYFIRWPQIKVVRKVYTCEETQCEIYEYNDKTIYTACTCDKHFYNNRRKPDESPF